MTLPKTYKVAVFNEVNGPLVLEDRELKMPGRGEVLVKVIATGVCHSDQDLVAGKFGASFPIVPGHETIGDVVAVPDTEDKWVVGDRVGAGWHGGHEGHCRQCQLGFFQICEKEAINGVTRDGGYADYVTLRTEAVVRVPKDVDPAEYAPMLCAGVTVFNSIRRQHVMPGELVAVEGLGGLGHLAVQFANKMGFRVVALSHGDDKRTFAKELGAHDYINTSSGDENKKLQEMGGAALIVCTAPFAKSIGPLTGALAPNGKLLVLAPSGTIEVNTGDLIMKGLSVGGFPSGHALDSEDCIEFAKLTGVKCMIERFPMKETAAAFEHMKSGAARFRAVITFD